MDYMQRAIIVIALVGALGHTRPWFNDTCVNYRGEDLDDGTCVNLTAVSWNRSQALSLCRTRGWGHIPFVSIDLMAANLLARNLPWIGDLSRPNDHLDTVGASDLVPLGDFGWIFIHRREIWTNDSLCDRNGCRYVNATTSNSSCCQWSEDRELSFVCVKYPTSNSTDAPSTWPSTTEYPKREASSVSLWPPETQQTTDSNKWTMQNHHPTTDRAASLETTTAALPSQSADLFQSGINLLKENHSGLFEVVVVVVLLSILVSICCLCCSVRRFVKTYRKKVNDTAVYYRYSSHVTPLKFHTNVYEEL